MRRREYGYISRKNIQRWLEHYQALQSGDRIDDGKPINSGPKPLDGISGGRINLIMLDQAIDKLGDEQPLTYRCIIARWLKPTPLGEALRALGLSKEDYYQHCREGVDFIYATINGSPAEGYQRLAELILKS